MGIKNGRFHVKIYCTRSTSFIGDAKTFFTSNTGTETNLNIGNIYHFMFILGKIDSLKANLEGPRILFSLKCENRFPINLFFYQFRFAKTNLKPDHS